MIIALSIYRFDIELKHTVQCEFEFLFDSTIHIPFEVFFFLIKCLHSIMIPMTSAVEISYNRFHHLKKKERRRTEFLTLFEFQKRPSIAARCLFKTKTHTKKMIVKIMHLKFTTVDHTHPIVCLFLLSIHSFSICVSLLSTQCLIINKITIHSN